MEHFRDPTDRNLSSRERVMWAGLCHLRDSSWSVLEKGFDKRAIADLAKISPQTLYNAMATDPRDAGLTLLETIARFAFPEESQEAYLDQIETGIHEVFRETVRSIGKVEGFRAVTAGHFEDVITNPLLDVQMMLVLAGRDNPSVIAANALICDLAQEGYERLFTKLFDEWELTIEPPMTIRHLCLGMTAMIEGFWLRQISDPTITSEEVALCVERFFTPNTPPISARPLRLPARAKGVIEQDVFDAASVAANRLDGPLTFAFLESELGIRVQDLTRTYQTVEGFIDAFWAQYRLELQRSMPPGQAGSAQLRPGLVSLAQAVKHHPGMARCYLSARIHDRQNRPSTLTKDPVVTPFIDPVIAWRKSTGAPVDRPTARRMATAIVQTLMAQALLPPTRSTADHDRSAAAVSLTCELYGIKVGVDAPAKSTPRPPDGTRRNRRPVTEG